MNSSTIRISPWLLIGLVLTSVTISCGIGLIFANMFIHDIRAEELTVADLAGHLNVTAWQATADLPPGLFGMKLVEVKDGAVLREIVNFSISSKRPGTKLAILVGPVRGDGVTKATIIFGNAVTTLFDGDTESGISPMTMVSASVIWLPLKIGEGSHILGGEFTREMGATNLTQNISNMKKGVVMTISKDVVK